MRQLSQNQDLTNKLIASCAFQTLEVQKWFQGRCTGFGSMISFKKEQINQPNTYSKKNIPELKERLVREK